jgi:hypothetical protein
LIVASVTGQDVEAHKRLAARFGQLKEEAPEEEKTPGPYFYLWGWFISLHRRRGFDGMSGLSLPISWEAIRAWCDVQNIILASHEIRLIEALDDVFIIEERKEKKRLSKLEQGRHKGKR